MVLLIWANLGHFGADYPARLADDHLSNLRRAGSANIGLASTECWTASTKCGVSTNFEAALKCEEVSEHKEGCVSPRMPSIPIQSNEAMRPFGIDPLAERVRQLPRGFVDEIPLASISQR